MRYINNFIKLRELTAEDEYRKAKGLPPKEDLSPYDILEKYKDDPMVMISFRDEYYTKTKRLGMNLSSSYNTPNGIYCYPLSLMWKNFDHQNRKILGIPFTGKEKAMSIVIMRLKDRGLNLKNYTAQNYYNDKEILNKKFTIDSYFIEKNTEKYFSKLGKYNNYYSYSYYIWGVTRDIFREIKGYSDYFVDDEYDDEDDSLDESILNEGVISTNYWNFIFSKILGYKWIIDEGLGIIHHSEPIQCVIFENSAYDLIDSIDISKIDYKKSRNDLSLENKLLDFLKKLIKDGNVKRIKILLNTYPKILNTKDNSGNSLLHIACLDNQIDIVKLLLQHPNIDVHTKNNKGWTPLYIACEYDNIQIVKLLLQHPKIDVNVKDISGWTPLYIACYNNNIELVKLLLAHPDIDVNIQNNNGNSPLHIACSYNKVEIVKLLLAHPDIDIQNNSGETPLHKACVSGNLEIVKLLLEHPNIDVNSKNKFEETPLYQVFKYKTKEYIEIVKLLLAHPNIDINMKNEYGVTLLDIAKRNKNQEFIDLFEEHGAKE